MEIYAGPTKRFFVSMLTRDIELKDCILDLLDNCVDGAMRSRRGRPAAEQPYAGFWAKITATGQRFQIEDNCGGIPWDVAQGSAFVLGRPDTNRDADLPTIGMYGIGMKRAIFKLGRDAVVLSNPSEGAFSVHYDAEWMNEDNDTWQLPIEYDVSHLPELGTRITITSLVDSVASSFDDEDGFLGDLKRDIAVYYGYIMSKGFTVELNGEEVDLEVLQLFAADGDGGINPYYFHAEVDGVDISVSVGFRRPLASDAEIDDEQVAPRTSDEAGVTIICNDRVVVLNDKGRLTGWGDGGVPKYHNQFISISGEIVFHSNDASKLPLTTTKRGVDAATDVYLTARSYAIEGLKLATSFTNKWKGMESETDELFRASSPSRVRAFAERVDDQLSRVREIQGARRYVPRLPTPVEEKRTTRVSFSKPADEVRQVAKFLFDDQAARPSLVGEACFDKLLEQAKR